MSCLSCNSSAPRFQCSRCNAAAYCNAECQRAHWKTHKPDCLAAAGHPAAKSVSRSAPPRQTPVQMPGQMPGHVSCRSCARNYSLVSGRVHSVITRGGRLSFSCMPCRSKVPGMVVPPNYVCISPICTCCMHMSDLDTPVNPQVALADMENLTFKCPRCVQSCPAEGPCQLHLTF